MYDWRGEVERRLRRARLDGAAEREIAEELAQHLEDRFGDLVAGGMPAAAAREQVLSELGDGDALADRVSRARTAAPEPLPLGAPPRSDRLAGLWSDVRFGARMLGRTPLYTLVAMALIALGIGATTVVFTVVNALLLRPLPGVADPHELAVVFTSDYSGPLYGSSSYPDYEALRDDAQVFEDATAYTLQPVSVVGDGWSARGAGEVVAANYFDVLGVSPVTGRFFDSTEGVPGRTTSVAVISHHLWQRHFHGAVAAVGSSIRVRGEPFTIIGVAPPTFRGAVPSLRVDVWLPVSAPAALTGNVTHRGNRSYAVIGRLRDDVTVATAQQRLNVLASRLHASFPDAWTDVNDRARVLTVVPESEARVPRAMRGAVIGFLALLMAAVVMVMLIASTNVANLMLTRAAARRAEMGIRVALGATRARIVRHMLAESLLLALLGGAAGVLVALWLTRLLNAVQLPVPVPVSLHASVDLRVLAFATAATLLTGMLFGLAPALQATRAPAPLMRDDARAGTRLRLRHTLVVLQVAASLVLLVGAGLFVRSLRAAQHIDTGFDAQSVMLASFDLSTEGYTAEQSAQFYEQLQERVGALRGTSSYALAETLPLGLGSSRRRVTVEGYEPQPGEDMETMFNGVTPGYFRTVGIALRQGREFRESDRAGAPPVAIVTEAFARRFWGGQNPLGRQVSFSGPDGPWAEVIGVAPDAKYRSLAEEPQPYVYYPYQQRPAADMTLLVRTGGDPDVLATALRSELRSLAPSLPPASIVGMQRHFAVATLPQRIAAMLLSALGVIAVVIALIGLYGLVAFGAAQRAREFGIRMALGAKAGDVRGLVMRGALRLVALGILLGAPAAAAMALLIRSFLMVEPLDPVAFTAVPLLLAACALLASYGPARRATRQDPARSLRAE